MAMDFFQHQDRARKNTKLLLVYFVLAVASIVLLVYAAAMVGYNAAEQKVSQSRYAEYRQSEPPLILWNAKVFLGAVFGTLAVIFIGSAWKTSQLSGGGGSVATMMGGRRITQQTQDPDERKLLNVIEEMSIASGVPMPEVYVMEQEQGINAFAAGHSTSDAAIGVTRGCIRLLSRDELQGVIGHEFSHILNGDMKLNLRLMGVVFGILCLTTIGRILLRTRGKKNPLPIFGLALVVIGFLGVFFGRLIQAAVSRQREFLADSSAVQFTRNPDGLSGALKKIGCYSYGSKLQSEHASDMCHMFFGNGLGESWFNSMATHPPIPVRIRAIDPNWDGKFPPLKPEQAETILRAAHSELKRKPPLPQVLNTILGGAVLAESAARPPVIQSDSMMRNIGNPTPLHLQYAEQLRDSLSENLRAAAREPFSAVAMIYAMLLSDDATVRERQFAELTGRAPSAVVEKIHTLLPDVTSAAARARLPLVNLALPALRELDAGQFSQFSKTLQWLINSDDRVELFEFVLQKIVLRHLAPKFGGAHPGTVQFYTLKPLVPDCAVILSALANVGSEEAGEIQKSFLAGAPYLRAPQNAGLLLVPRGQCGVEQVGESLDRLALAVPIIKKNLLEAAARVVGADGVLNESEAELLRAIADALDCPMPPLGVV